MNKDLLQNIAQRIKSLRKKYGYTQDDLSYRANIARSTLGNIETASNDVTITKINNIANGFGMSLSEFFDFKS